MLQTRGRDRRDLVSRASRQPPRSGFRSGSQSLPRSFCDGLGRGGAMLRQMVQQRRLIRRQIGGTCGTVVREHALSRSGSSGAKFEASAGQLLRFSTGAAGTGGTAMISNTFSGPVAHAPSGAGGTGHARGPIGPMRYRDARTGFLSCDQHGSTGPSRPSPKPALCRVRRHHRPTPRYPASPHRPGGVPLPRRPAVSSCR
jgi:hypothetical protein